VKTLTALLDETEADPTAAARKAKTSGQRVIGFANADVPVELIDASGGFALSLAHCASGPTPHADQYLEASFSHLERSIAEAWLSGKLELLDAVIFSRGSDSSQRLYYYLCELQRRQLTCGPRPLLFDLAKIPRASSVAYSYDATRELAAALGVQAERLQPSIARRNRRRQLLQSLQGLRSEARSPRGTLIERVSRLADCCEADEFDTALAHWMREVRPVLSGARLLLSGSAPCDGTLQAAVEDAGGSIVAEAGDHDLERLGGAIAADEADPLRALSGHYQGLPHGSRAFLDRAGDLQRRMQNSRAQGAIFWLLEEEEALVWDLPRQQQALQELSIPALTLTRQPSTISEQTLTSVRAFVARLAMPA
jgi:benzoyl-CoA reductase/2-hydroxyglutaryl-CoA dehydratase subunit BcrC/BadD/HgdB